MSTEDTIEYLANVIAQSSGAEHIAYLDAAPNVAGPFQATQARMLAEALLADPRLEIVLVAPEREKIQPEVGQVWRTDNTKRLRLITAITNTMPVQVKWRALDGSNPREGSAHLHYWASRNTFINDHGKQA